MTKDELQLKHPEVYQAIFKEGAESVDSTPMAEALDKAKAEGAKEESQRVTDVRAQSLPGHEVLIETLVADGKTTGPEAAMAINKAQQDVLAAQRDKLGEDGKKLLAASEPSKGEGGEDKKDFLALVKAEMEGGMTRGAATSKVCKDHPDAHADWVAGLKPQKKEDRSDVQ